MGAFGKIKGMYSLQKKAKAAKKKLKNIHIEAEADGVTIVLDGEMKVVSVSISDEAMQMGKEKLQAAFEKALSKALKKAQEVAGAEMKGVWGEMGMPGM